MTLRIFAGRTMATLGTLIVLVELMLYWLSPYLLGGAHAIGGAAIAIGCLFGFVGYYMLDHKETAEGAQIIVTSAVRIADALPRPGFLRPGGRRTGDNAVIVTPTPKAPSAQADAPETGEAP